MLMFLHHFLPAALGGTMAALPAVGLTCAVSKGQQMELTLGTVCMITGEATTLELNRRAGRAKQS
jgi:hypothetical protein